MTEKGISLRERAGNRITPRTSRYGYVLAISLFLFFTLIAQPPGVNAQESAADKAKREEILRRNAQIEEQNRKITANNAIVVRTYTAGNAAYLAGRYDEAIAQYNEGLAADPEQVALLLNKILALNRRGIDRYNSSLKSGDDVTSKAGREAAGRDWREAFDSASRAVALVKANSPSTGSNSVSVYSARAEAGRLLARNDKSVGEAVFKAYQEYVAVEPDEGKRLKARNDAGQLLIDTGLAERAVTEFRNLLNENPYNVDAILGLGMALFTTGDKNRYKEAATYLQQFVKTAPDTHAKKAWARQTLRELEGYIPSGK